jgi:hypothetical protein
MLLREQHISEYKTRGGHRSQKLATDPDWRLEHGQMAKSLEGTSQLTRRQEYYEDNFPPLWHVERIYIQSQYQDFESSSQSDLPCGSALGAGTR